jgi:hypothetical protein
LDTVHRVPNLSVPPGKTKFMAEFYDNHCGIAAPPCVNTVCKITPGKYYENIIIHSLSEIDFKILFTYTIRKNNNLIPIIIGIVYGTIIITGLIVGIIKLIINISRNKHITTSNDNYISNEIELTDDDERKYKFNTISINDIQALSLDSDNLHPYIGPEVNKP